MATTHDVIVIGGGVVGAACAAELAGTGRSVLMLAPIRDGEAWRASAGMLAPQIETAQDSPLFELGIAGREYFRDRAAQIAADTGIDIGLYDGGILRLAGGEREAHQLRAAVAWQRQHSHAADWLDPGEVAEQFPWAGESAGALWASHDGSVDPVKVVEAFRTVAQRRGAEMRNDAAVELVSGGGRITAVRGQQDTYSAGDVVLAAGAWSGRIAGLPRPVSVEPVRGQMLARPWPASVPPGIVFGAHGYVLERLGEALCGATMEHAGFAPTVTEDGLASVIEATDRLLPALAGSTPGRSWAGLRPGTPDGLPIFGREPALPNLWYATGYGRNGILLSGISAVALCHLLANEATFDGVDAMRPNRFWNW
ncbi:MAG: glycine oxidase ThiO [Gemmatimonadales bacterium]